MRCSFCGKDQQDVRKLIAGPKVFVCDECIGICNNILAEDRKSSAADAEPGTTSPLEPVGGFAVQCALCRMPIVWSDGVPIASRGFLCAGCLGEIEAALAGKRESAT